MQTRALGAGGESPLRTLERLLPCLLLSWLVQACSGPSSGAPTGGLVARNLRCEYLVDPLGIDEREPRLSWVLEPMSSALRGQFQTAYQILAADDPALLAIDRGNLWDSGRVPSDDSIHVVYAGRPLDSERRVWWKVRVWDEAKKRSAWSEVASWSMGLLETSDWQAEWIGYDEPLRAKADEPTLEGASWIWFAGDPERDAPAGKRWFRLDFSWLEPPTNQQEPVELLIAADNQFVLHVNGRRLAASDGKEYAWRRPLTIDLRPVLLSRDNTVAVEVENTAAGPAGLIAQARLSKESEASVEVQLLTWSDWKCTDQPVEGWEQPGFDDASWPDAAVVGKWGDEPWGKISAGGLFLPPPRCLAKEIQVGKPLRRATLYGTALGICELQIDGQKVGGDWFTPGWTDYDTRVYYRTWDVTGMLERGDHVLSATLADGWYAGYVGYGGKREHYGERTRLLAQLRLEYANGTTETIGTDASWRATVGPLAEADFLMGESYDARRALDLRRGARLDPAVWQPVDLSAPSAEGPRVQAHPGPPVRVIAELPPVSITEPAPGTWVLDLGQNIAGVARLSVSGKPGQEIRLRYAERLNPDGTLYTANLRGARATDTYVCRGGGREVWEPHFTFHGFQYVELRGLEEQPSRNTVTGLALSSATPVAGSFECSDPMLNRLYANICWTQWMNFIDIPTDCPQRDERMGWTGDAQIYIRTASLNSDVQAFFTKWLVDLEDAQRADGQFPMVAPLKVAGGDGGPAWADAGVICPWTIYEVYGDERQLARHYESMARFIAFCEGRSTPEGLPPKEFHCFGDWVSVGADTPTEVIYTAYFANSARLLARSAAALGKREDAVRYQELFERVKQAFNRAYVAADGTIHGDTQCGYVLAIAFDLVDGERREQAARHLVLDLEERGCHLTTGFIGTKDLMLALSKIGREDLAYRLLFNTTFPSWGFSIRHGATSIWERWNGWTPEEGFNDPGMNSFAHYSFGAVGQWMFETLGGIHTEGPAFKRILLAPRPPSTLAFARLGYDSIRGRIESRWERTGNELRLDVTVPPNTTARVHLPTNDPAKVKESGKPARGAPGVKFRGREAGAVVFEVGSGRYAFTATGARAIVPHGGAQ